MASTTSRNLPFGSSIMLALGVLGAAALLNCGDDDGATTLTTGPATGTSSGGSGGGTTSTGGATTSSNNGGSTATGGSGSSVGGSGGSAVGGAGGSSVSCDYQFENGVLVIEPETLTLPAMWEVGTDFPGYTGAGFIRWTGAAQNNNPGQGLISLAISVPAAGRYRFQWHNRIGNGNNATEHNDTWVRFPNAADYYGLKGNAGAEIRRYHKPLCEDANAMNAIEALNEVSVANCVMGSTSDGWLKVYSSGATDWRWSTFTSDNDGSAIMAEFPGAGVYTLELSARADLHLIDRIVMHEESVANAVAQDLALPHTPCP